MLNRNNLKIDESNKNSNGIQLAKLNIYKQATMAALAVVVTIVLIFAMSVAWYSNVIHSEGLVFEVASWDFDFEGQVEIAKDSQGIFPGDSGIVEMNLENESDSSIAVLVNVTKDTENFIDAMKKRIYFYVEDSQVVNEETVERVYINETDEYKYMVMPGNSLVLSEEYHSDPYLKWEWVYDVLGYYVTGTMENSQMNVTDYMRPVVYDYDTATYHPDTGELLTVNAGISVEDYLTELYATDGYQGTYKDASGNAVEKINGYYPVVVDETTGYGIWLYLCNKEEIEENIAFDTEYAKLITNEFSAKLLLSGQKASEQVASVSTVDGLKTALNDGLADKIVLTGDMEISEKIAVTNTDGVVLNLAGHTLTIKTDGFEVQKGASFTLLGGTETGSGTIVGSSGNEIAVRSTGGEVTLHGVTIQNVARAVNIVDDDAAADKIDSRVKITNCNFDAGVAGVFVRGNAGQSARKTSVLIENTIITSDGYGVVGNGSASASGTDIEVVKCTITGAWSGIYQPQANSSIKVTDSTISGSTGFSIKAGTVTIMNTKVTGTGANNPPAFSASGVTSTGDAVYIETNYEVPIELYISGENTLLQSANSLALQVYEETSEFVTVEVSGGIFSSEIKETFLAEGYECKSIVEGRYEVGPVTQTP